MMIMVMVAVVVVMIMVVAVVVGVRVATGPMLSSGACREALQALATQPPNSLLVPCRAMPRRAASPSPRPRLH